MQKKKDSDKKSEVLQLLQGMFQTFDLDDSGELDKDELKKVFEFLDNSETSTLFEKVGLSMETIITAVQLADHDDNGQVSYAEFMDAMHTLNDQTQKQDLWQLQLQVRETLKMQKENSSVLRDQGKAIGDLNKSVSEMTQLMRAQGTVLEELRSAVRAPKP